MQYIDNIYAYIGEIY